jgi:ferredoxin
VSRTGAREPEIPEDQLRYARAAVKKCPRLALQLLSDHD